MKTIRLLAETAFALLAASAFAETVLPPLEAGALDRLAKSPRHSEWATINADGGDKVNAFVVYPERPDKAPVVLVVHEIYGLSDWVRAVADQLAAEGFIAVAPDFLTGKGPNGQGSRGLTPDQAQPLFVNLQMPEIINRLNAAARYATSLPAATGSFAVVGFCWGGGISYAYATSQPALKAAVVFYGVSPSADALAKVQAPVLGLYGGDDARVTSTVSPAQAEMTRLGKRYEAEIYAGAGHAFMRMQDGRNGANMNAAQQGWPRAVQFLKQNLSSGVSLQTAPAPMLQDPVPFVASEAATVVALAESDGCDDTCCAVAPQL